MCCGTWAGHSDHNKGVGLKFWVSIWWFYISESFVFETWCALTSAFMRWPLDQRPKWSLVSAWGRRPDTCFDFYRAPGGRWCSFYGQFDFWDNFKTFLFWCFATLWRIRTIASSRWKDEIYSRFGLATDHQLLCIYIPIWVFPPTNITLELWLGTLLLLRAIEAKKDHGILFLYCHIWFRLLSLHLSDSWILCWSVCYLAKRQVFG